MYQTRKEGRKEGSPLRHRLNLPYHARSTSWLGEVDPMPFGGTKRRLHTLIRFQILSAKTFTHIIIYTWIFQLCHMFLNEKVEMSHSWKINTMSSLWHRYVESQKVTVTPREQNAFVLRAGNNPGHPSGSFSLCTDSRSPGAASPQAQSRGICHRCDRGASRTLDLLQLCDPPPRLGAEHQEGSWVQNMQRCCEVWETERPFHCRGLDELRWTETEGSFQLLADVC